MRALFTVSCLSMLFCACGGYPAAGTWVMDREATLPMIPDALRADVEAMTAEVLLQPDGQYQQRSLLAGQQVMTGGTWSQTGDSLSFQQQHVNGQPQSGTFTGKVLGDTLSVLLNTGEQQFVLVLRRAGGR